MCWWPWFEVPLSVLITPYWRESIIPDCFAESRTVFIPETSDTDNHGRVIRSLDAFRPLTLCNCDCKVLTSATRPSLVHYAMSAKFRCPSD